MICAQGAKEGIGSEFVYLRFKHFSEKGVCALNQMNTVMLLFTIYVRLSAQTPNNHTRWHYFLDFWIHPPPPPPPPPPPLAKANVSLPFYVLPRCSEVPNISYQLSYMHNHIGISGLSKNHISHALAGIRTLAVVWDSEQSVYNHLRPRGHIVCCPVWLIYMQFNECCIPTRGAGTGSREMQWGANYHTAQGFGVLIFVTFCAIMQLSCD